MSLAEKEELAKENENEDEEAWWRVCTCIIVMLPLVSRAPAKRLL